MPSKLKRKLPPCRCLPKVKPTFPNKMVMMKCREDPPHPCDPPLPCFICSDDDPCPKPRLCKNRIKNPEIGWKTKCKSGKSVSVEICGQDPPHPCDPPPPCIPGQLPKIQCTVPVLCKQRVKNLPPKDKRCHPDPEDFYSRTLCENLDLLKQEIVYPGPSCEFKLINPHNTIVKKKEVKSTVDPNEYLYSRTLCKHMALLRTPIKPFKVDICKPLKYINPFEDEEERRRKVRCDIPEDPCYEPWVL